MIPDKLLAARFSGVAFLCAVFVTAVLEFAGASCGCPSCSIGVACRLYTAPPSGLDVSGGLGTEPRSSEFRVSNRWFTTALDTDNRFRGDPLHLTWSIVDDGTTISGSEGTSPSDLIDMLNRRYGSGATIETAPWFRLFQSSFDRWSDLSGLTFTYEPNDGGAAIDGTSSPRGLAGVYADIRIGGHSIDGSSGPNTLAYNYFPSHGDMVIDTDNESFYASRSGDSLPLRNVLMHEIGHGLGFSHLESDNGSFLMEPFISTSFDGPQIDDILAAHRNYGDRFEKNGGNDTFVTATPVGELSDGETWDVGGDATGFVVFPSQTDFVSIDGATDSDWYRFTVDQPGVIFSQLFPRGPTYLEGPQGGAQTELDTSSLADLGLSLYTLDGVGNLAELAEIDTPVAGRTEQLVADSLQPGNDYFVRVASTDDNVQLYELFLLFAATPIPEPAGLALALVVAACRAARRTR